MANKIRSITFKIEENLANDFKILAINRNTTMKDLLTDFIKSELEKENLNNKN